MFQRCGRQYQFRYEEGRKEPPALKPTAGKAGHAGIEAHMRAKMITGTDAPVDLMLDSFDTAWNRESTDMVAQPEENPGKTKDGVAWTLRDYHARKVEHIVPRAVELEFMLPLVVADRMLPPIKGFIDLLKVPANGPATLDVEDTKFVFPDRRGVVHPKTQADADWSEQLTIYDMALHTAGIHADRIGLVSMTPPIWKGDDPIPHKMPDVIPVYRDPALMDPAVRAAMLGRMRRKIQLIVEAIEHGTFIPTNDPRTCSWCGFRKVCPDSLAKDDFLAQHIREETP